MEKYIDIDIDIVKEKLALFGPNLLAFFVVLIVGFKVVRMINAVIGKAFEKKGLDPSLKSFLQSCIGIALKTCVLLAAVSNLGIQTTSFLTILGSAGLAVGLALQGSLSNFAGGVMILLFKPFKLGDVIEALGHTGSVSSINIFHTQLNTPDNKVIILSNGPLANGPIVNYSKESTRRVDFTFGVGYNDDLKLVRSTLEEIIQADSRILKDPAPFIGLSELADSSVNFVVRTWVNASDYWGVFFDTNEKVKTIFDEKKISIPFPQRDVHHHNQS